VANDGGTASDAYLNIAKYATIDEAGATVSGMTSIYKYTVNGDAAWLTLSCYGAMSANDNQNWYQSDALTRYGNTWTATDVFAGQTAYFGSSSAYSIYGSGSQSFYVTNCTQSKALSRVAARVRQHCECMSARSMPTAPSQQQPLPPTPRQALMALSPR
jgi:hypothetical protein